MIFTSRSAPSLPSAHHPKVLVVLLLAAGLVGCQPSGDESEETAAPPVVEVTAADYAFQAPRHDDDLPYQNLGPTSSASPLAQDTDWHELILLSFDTAKSRRARALTEDCLHQAAASPGTPVPRVIELPGGPWDLLLIYSLGRSVSEAPALEKKWKSPADLGRLREACRKAGEEGHGMWKEYKGLLESSTSFVGFSGRMGRRLAGF